MKISNSSFLFLSLKQKSGRRRERAILKHQPKLIFFFVYPTDSLSFGDAAEPFSPSSRRPAEEGCGSFQIWHLNQDMHKSIILLFAIRRKRERERARSCFARRWCWQSYASKKHAGENGKCLNMKGPRSIVRSLEHWHHSSGHQSLSRIDSARHRAEQFRIVRNNVCNNVYSAICKHCYTSIAIGAGPITMPDSGSAGESFPSTRFAGASPFWSAEQENYKKKCFKFRSN